MARGREGRMDQGIGGGDYLLPPILESECEKEIADFW